MRILDTWRRVLIAGLSLAVWACGLGGLPRAQAQIKSRPPLEFEIDQSAWALRAGAPVSLRLKITCASAGIMEGNLELHVNDNTGTTVALIRIPDQVYSPGRQEVEYLLPLQSHALQNVMGITCFFHDKNKQSHVSTGQLTLPSRRSFVVSIVGGRGADETGADDFAWLMLESRCPQHSLNPTITPMLTMTRRMLAADVPRDPLKHLPHDIVVVEAGGFTELVGPQVHALEAWVKGGGSLFLQYGKQELSTEQQAFVERLTAKKPDVLDDEVEGTTLIPLIRGQSAIALEYGFGHVWLTTQRSWDMASETDRLAAYEFLWRLRPEHHDSLGQSGELSLNPANREQQTQWNQYQYSGAYPGSQIPSGGSGILNFEQNQILIRWGQLLQEARSSRPNEMIEALMPRDVQAVPVWLLSSMILVYIAAIGFGDYIILGKLKRRRWTWFTFPAMTLLVSLLSIGTAKGYLGTSQELSAVEFRDVANDGTLCRVQRFELLFRSSSGRAETKLDQVAYTPVARQNPGSQNYQGGMQAIDAQMIVIEGIPTAQATVTQQIEQWKPQLNRTVSFPRDQKAPLTLPVPEAGMSLSSPQYAKQLEANIRETWPNYEGHFFFAHTGVVAGQNALHHTVNTIGGAGLLQLMTNCQPLGSAPNQGGSGLFTLFNQISPSADTGLADMVIATPGHEVLCVAVREANNELVIYRWRFPVP